MKALSEYASVDGFPHGGKGYGIGLPTTVACVLPPADRISVNIRSPTSFIARR